MGARKRMKHPFVERAMFVRCRRQRDQMKRELRDLGFRFGGIRKTLGKLGDSYKELRTRFKVLLRIGPFVLMKDLLPRVREQRRGRK